MASLWLAHPAKLGTLASPLYYLAVQSTSYSVRSRSGHGLASSPLATAPRYPGGSSNDSHRIKKDKIRKHEPSPAFEATTFLSSSRDGVSVHAPKFI